LIPIFALTTACGGGGGGGGSTNNSGNNDTDNDGVANATDVDGDNDGLIEVLSLEQLDWMRHDLTGTSRNDGQGNVSSAGCPAAGCNGYELAANLDFDTNGDGQMTAADAYYDYDNDGANNGWLPIGNSASAFDANFNGNNRRIANLFIDRPAGDAETSGTEIGLFGQIRNDQNGSTSQPIAIQNIRLDGPLASVTGHSFVGALAGVVRASNGSITVSNIDVDAQVTGESSIAASNVGGLAGLTWGGNALGLVMSDNSVSGTVTGGGTVGGMIGQMNGASTLSNAISDAMVIAELDQVGGLVGAVFPSEPEPTIAPPQATCGGGLMSAAHSAMCASISVTCRLSRLRIARPAARLPAGKRRLAGLSAERPSTTACPVTSKCVTVTPPVQLSASAPSAGSSAIPKANQATAL
jgi:hypothetical protein